MMCWDIRNFNKDLQTFIELVDKYKIPCEIIGIYSLIGKLNEINNFDYKLTNIVFKIDKKISGGNPNNMEEYSIFLDNIIRTNKSKNLNNDCILEYLFEINIEGHTPEKKLKSCWHLDKHIESKGSNDGTPKFTHPSYHFQFGGNFIENCDKGELGILSSPRIPHPPMDIFLGFNFIVNNFYSKKDYEFVNKLLEDYRYQEIIKRAQERLWIPYFKAFDSSNTHNDFKIEKIFPLYIL
ncbi:hypothetical protein NGQ54_03440 [Riemerella anatipestifer]|uniref:hypothetical protein n=1 Tax=Riemerella anatipestifer TaxID=34085 RepID=UPI00208E3F2C|nr:hypothetical protein [Riemerella anatipestifer]MCO4303648.1 hypothetical protein [Riemerella anatipestifer]MCT6760682.1 hypothetical protein [Riemerella anatipestifer]MCU7599429.1 hypothetical protein [Riemerella anatipestifer]MCU7605404.1 hypothetical protein [Riemerella anatipestifer]